MNRELTHHEVILYLSMLGVMLWFKEAIDMFMIFIACLLPPLIAAVKIAHWLWKDTWENDQE